MGYVDVDFYSLDLNGMEPFKYEPTKLSCQACKFQILDDETRIKWESFKNAAEDKKKSAYSDALETYVGLLDQFEDREKRREIEANLNSMEVYFKKL